MTQISKQKQITGWIVFDWANSAYNLVIVSTVFPIIFNAFVPNGSTFLGITFASSDSLYTYAMCFSYLIISLITPVLSGIADYGGYKKRYMQVFSTMGAIACASLFLFDKEHKYKNKILFFGIASAIALTIHSIFLGVKFDNDLYKLFRRVIMLTFIIFEITAQAYLVAAFYSFRHKLNKYINKTFLNLKIVLVSTLIVVAVISVPIISLPGNDFFGFNLKFLKHALEWDYFIGVISFYLLTFFLWKKN